MATMHGTTRCSLCVPRISSAELEVFWAITLCDVNAGPKPRAVRHRQCADSTDL